MRYRTLLACSAIGACVATTFAGASVTAVIEQDTLALDRVTLLEDLPGFTEADVDVWNVFAEFTSPDYQLLAVLGDPVTSLIIETSATGGFVSTLAGSQPLAADTIDANPVTNWDSFYTIDEFRRTDSPLNMSTSPGLAELGDDTPWPPSSQAQSSAYVASPFSAGAPAGDDLRVLILRLVVPKGESITGLACIQWRTGPGTFSQFQPVTFQTPLPPCPGDTSGDQTVDALDLNNVLAQFGQSGPDLISDLNEDGEVNALDLNEVLGAFGNTCD